MVFLHQGANPESGEEQGNDRGKMWKNGATRGEERAITDLCEDRGHVTHNEIGESDDNRAHPPGQNEKDLLSDAVFLAAPRHYSTSANSH